MKYFKKLMGDRIYLSPRNNEDIEKFTEWLNDFETTDYIGRSAYIMTLEGEKQYLEENLNKNYNFFIITLNEDKLIGTVGLEHYDSINIKLDLISFNERALKCYTKCGFKEYGRRRNCKYINGKYYDSIEMDILANEFEGDYIRNKNI